MPPEHVPVIRVREFETIDEFVVGGDGRVGEGPRERVDQAVDLRGIESQLVDQRAAGLFEDLRTPPEFDEVRFGQPAEKVPDLGVDDNVGVQQDPEPTHCGYSS